MSTEYVHVGRHADILASCRHLAPGERINSDELTDEDRHLIDEGRLVTVDSFTEGESNKNALITDQQPNLAAAQPVSTVQTSPPRPAAATASAMTTIGQEGEHGDS